MTNSMRALALCVALTLPISANAQDVPDASWHLLTKTYGGNVTLLKNLTEHECDFARNRELGLPATDSEKLADTEYRVSVSKKWDAWRKLHDCKDEMGEGSTTAMESEKSPDGMCIRGAEFALPGEGIHQVSAGDIQSAECFK